MVGATMFRKRSFVYVVDAPSVLYFWLIVSMNEFLVEWEAYLSKEWS